MSDKRTEDLWADLAGALAEPAVQRALASPRTAAAVKRVVKLADSLAKIYVPERPHPQDPDNRTSQRSKSGVASADRKSPHEQRPEAEQVKTMSKDARIAFFVEKLRAFDETPESHHSLVQELNAKESGVKKDEMVRIAKTVVPRAYKTKQDALFAIDRWLAQQVRGKREGDRIYNSAAS